MKTMKTCDALQLLERSRSDAFDQGQVESIARRALSERDYYLYLARAFEEAMPLKAGQCFEYEEMAARSRAAYERCKVRGDWEAANPPPTSPTALTAWSAERDAVMRDSLRDHDRAIREASDRHKEALRQASRACLLRKVGILESML